MAGSSSQPFYDDGEPDDPSLALALRLQQEEDEALALALQEEEAAVPPPSARRPPPSPQQRAPGVVLDAPAHKAVQHLGRGTCKKLETHFKLKGGLTLRELLRLFAGDRREEMMMLIDAGQRQRVEAELVAQAIDHPMT
jgi:hypothetical protein